jgi:hypothetical protein
MYSRKLLTMGRGNARNKIKLGKFVLVVGYLKTSIMMHGNMNVKFVQAVEPAAGLWQPPTNSVQAH